VTIYKSQTMLRTKKKHKF